MGVLQRRNEMVNNLLSMVKARWKFSMINQFDFDSLALLLERKTTHYGFKGKRDQICLGD